MANKQETDWMAKIISAIILAIAVYLIFRPVSYLLKSWKIQKENKATIQGLHHNPGDFWLTEQEKQQFLFHTAQAQLADEKSKSFPAIRCLSAGTANTTNGIETEKKPTTTPNKRISLKRSSNSFPALP